MTREKILLRNAIKVVEIDGCIDAWNNIRPECTESDFPIEGILDVVKN